MTKSVKWSPDAETDLLRLLSYLESHWGRGIVNQFLDLLDANIELIVKEPQMFPFLNKKLNIRKCVLTKQNTLFYREKARCIEIVRLFDTRQNLNKIELI